MYVRKMSVRDWIGSITWLTAEGVPVTIVYVAVRIRQHSSC